MTWGLTPEGFNRPRFVDIRPEMESRWKAIFGANRNTGHDTVDGHFIDMLSEVLALVYEDIEGGYNAGFLDTVEGASLDLWMADRGFIRNGATHSTVTLRLTGTNGTVIQAGSRVRTTDNNQDWTTDEEVTIAGGTATVAATAVNAGPVAATSGSSWEIRTPVAGWTGVSNAFDAAQGRNEETDPELKARYMLALRLGGVGYHLLRLQGVTAVEVFQNDTDTPDGIYGETHWLEAIVVGGDDQEIVDTIQAKKAPGVGTVGDSSGTEAVTGHGYTVNFSRGTEREVYVTITITADEGFPDSSEWPALETEIQEALVEWANANHPHGRNVAPDLFRAQIASMVTGLWNADILLGFSAPPGTSGILTIPDRDFAAFDTSRLSVSIT